MKKRILSLLLAFALTLCFFPVGVSAAETDKQTWSHLTINGGTATGYCPHCCDEPSQTVTWTLLNRPNSGHANITAGGHYFLDKTTATNGALQPSTAGIEVVLHLNGQTFKRNGAGSNNTGALRPQAENTKTYIVDDQAQKGAIHGDYGWAVNTNGKAGSQITLYSGNLTSVVSEVATTGSNLNGGTIRLDNGVFEMYGGKVNGTNAVYGGSVFVSGSTTANIYGGTIQGGKATARGGNIYMASTTATLNISGGTIQNGVCEEKGIGGGNVYVNNGTFNLTGGTIQGGKAPKGGNIYSNTATTINGTANLKKGEAVYGGNLYVNKALTLGAVSFETGKATYGSDIYVAAKGNMTVDKTYNGTALVYYAMCHVPDKVLGGYLTHQTNVTFGSGDPINRCTGVFTGKLFLENTPGRPLISAKGTSKYLHIANTDSAALVDKSGNYTWYESQDDAIAAYNANTAYMIAGRMSMPLTGGDYVIDLAGHNVTITGTGSVTLFDSANADYKTYGTATVLHNTGVSLKNEFKTTVAGEDYYMVATDTNKYTFHRMGMEIIGLSVRPSKAGMYYTGMWQCDELLANEVESFGVAVSIANQPQENFATDNDTLYTLFDKADFESGVAKTGALIKGIVKEGVSQNATRSKQKVYAAAYVTFTKGACAITDEPVAHSLYNALEMAEANIYDHLDKVDDLKAFNETWTAAGVNWDFNFEISQDALNLLDIYSGKTAYHGEAHEHADTSGTSDGSYTLNQWKKSLEIEGLDFTTIVDHKQTSHMSNKNWDADLFIGGTEASTGVDKNANNKMHYSLIFTDEAAAKKIAEKYSYQKVLGVPVYKDLTTAQIQAMIGEVQAAGGMFTIVHPKSDGYFGAATKPEDYYFADWTGLEVFYGAGGYAPTQDVNVKNYTLWTDLLAQGKKIWATAGSDQHAGASTNALTTIYSHSSSSTDIFSYMKAGNSTCGPVGIRMAVGDTVMGSETDFASKRLIFSVDDFHESVYKPGHTYLVKLISDQGVVYETGFDASLPFFYGMDADDSANFYRVEVYDVTADYNLPIAIGNPIWNK